MRSLKILALAAATLAVAQIAQAVPVNFTYSGYFSSADSLTAKDGTVTALADATPFRLKAVFDDESENLVASVPLPGFVAYDPIRASIRIGGQKYRVATSGESLDSGISIAIFDQSNVSAPGKYGIGFIVDPVADGAGIIGRFGGASRNFTVDNLQTATMTGYIGAGFRSGVGPAGPGCFQNPLACAISPISLFDGDGDLFGLTIASRAETLGGNTDLIHSASIAPVPLPGGLALILGAFGAAAGWLALSRKGVA